MPIPGTIPVTGILAPTDSADTYSITDPLYGIDGYRSVADKTTRNLIPNDRRRYGMIVFTQDLGQWWLLNQSPWTGTDSDWTQLFITAGSSPSYRTSFTYASLSSGTLSVTHNIGQKYVGVHIYDDNDKQIIPDEIQLVNSNSLTIYMGSYGVISGTWNLVVLG